MDARRLPDASIPDTWFVAFHTTGVRPWVARLVPGKFKHVSAFAYCAGFRAWLVYDVALAGTQLALISGDAAEAALKTWTEGATVLTIRRRAPRLTLMPFCCVSALRHLLGVPGCALRPDKFFDECLRAGGKPVETSNVKRPP